MQASISDSAARDVGFVMRGGLRRQDYPSELSSYRLLQI